MLGLKLPTDPRWANIAEKNIEEILTDHAYCEQKAASTAISLIVGYPEKSELVDKMTALAREEMGHFQMVHNRIMARGLTLGRERKDAYVNRLSTFFPKGGDREVRLIYRLLICALWKMSSAFPLLSIWNTGWLARKAKHAGVKKARMAFSSLPLRLKRLSNWSEPSSMS